MNFKISIILPVYNVEHYLEDCLQSLVTQTLQDIEIIAINDGSTDHSLSVLENFQKRFPEKLFVYTTENLGVSHARNYGYSLSHGEYIWFIDSDDYIEKNACEKLYQKASSDQNDLVLFRYYTVDSDSGHKTESPFTHFLQNYRIYDTPSELLRISPFPWNKLIHRDLMKDLSFPEGIRFEDLPIAFLLGIRANSIGVINECLYDYRKNVGFLNQLTEETLDIIKAVRILKDTVTEWGLYKHYRKEIEFITARHFIYRFSHLVTNYETDKYELKCRIVNEIHGYMKEFFPVWKRNSYLTLYLPDYIFANLAFYMSPKEKLKFLEATKDATEKEQKQWLRRYRKRHADQLVCTAPVEEPPISLNLPKLSSHSRVLYYYTGDKLSDRIIQEFNQLASSNPDKEYVFAFHEQIPAIYMNRIHKLKTDCPYICIKPFEETLPLLTKLNTLQEKNEKQLSFLMRLQINHFGKKQTQALFGDGHFSEVILHTTSDVQSVLLFHYMTSGLTCYIDAFSEEDYETSEEYKKALDQLCLLLDSAGYVYLPENMASFPGIQALKNTRILPTLV